MDERKSGDTVRVFVHKNEAGAEGHAMRVTPSWNFKTFKKTACKKLKMKAVKRVFLASGVEITDVEDLQNGDMLFCSSGEVYYQNSSTCGRVGAPLAIVSSPCSQLQPLHWARCDIVCREFECGSIGHRSCGEISTYPPLCPQLLRVGLGPNH